MDWLNLLQVAKKCSKYACRSMGEPFSDEWESEGAFKAYEVGMLHLQGKVQNFDKYLAFCVIRQVRTAIVTRRRRNRAVRPTCRDTLALQVAKDASELLIDAEDQIFIQRMLDGKKCLKANEMMEKYATG